jgi:NADH:ubiquinone oxidoreductase subunit D
MYKKYVYIGLSIVAFLSTVLWISYKKNQAKKFYENYETVATIDSTKDTVYIDRMVMDSVQMERLRDSIQILNNMIKNNIQKPITKSNEKANIISKSSSKQYNDFLTDRYKNRK